jgi:hypothetical protein
MASKNVPVNKSLYSRVKSEAKRKFKEKGRPYPACRPSKRVSSKTPKTTGEMSSAEKSKFKRTKTSSKKISYQHKRKGVKKK